MGGRAPPPQGRVPAHTEEIPRCEEKIKSLGEVGETMPVLNCQPARRVGGLSREIAPVDLIGLFSLSSFLVFF